MAEKIIFQVKVIYGQLRGYLGETERQLMEVRAEIAEDVNGLIDKLSGVTSTDYSSYKAVAAWTPSRHRQYYKRDVFRARTNALIERLKSEYSFEQSAPSTQPAIVINNQNSNTIYIDINFTIQNLIDSAQTDDERENLQAIEGELKKPNANWDKIKTSLMWIINYSKELSLKVIPIILDYYLKHGG